MTTDPHSPSGYYMDRREKELIQRLLKPVDGEHLLDVGCRAGNYLRFFRGKGCDVTGTEPSQHMLDMTRVKLGQRADLCPGSYDDLPFSDNEFDIVTIIFPDSACNIQIALNEAIRVCRGRIFLGTTNRYSATSAHEMKKITPYCNTNRSSIPELIRLIRSALPGTSIKWGSVIFFPPKMYPAISFFEERIPVTRNPFGSFIGLAFPVTYNLITAQNPLVETSKTKAARRSPEPGAARRIVGK
ncbi:MAG: class I SAM-dependent methyltransferase [Thermodesulfobacteriota bacterium]|nr:class I SAM-dependent methyltransferase [Thermodesulfobacteriota bacterium]